VIARWSQNTRRSARVALNRTTKGGYRWHWATPDEIGDMADDLVTEHQQMWEGRGITPAHAEPRFVRFVRTVCERMARSDAAALVRIEAPDGADAPMRLCALMFIGHEYVGGWLSAYNDVAHRRLAIAVLESLLAVDVANRKRLGTMSMLRGLEAGKVPLHDRVKPNHRVLLAGSGAGAIVTWLRQLAPVAAVARLKEWEQHSETGQRVTGRLRGVRERFRR
jgi:hypothetical protein